MSQTIPPPGSGDQSASRGHTASSRDGRRGLDELAALLTERLENGVNAQPLPVLSEPEALVVAELLEQVATNQSNELGAIAQLLIVRIYDRLETSSAAKEPTEAQGTPRRPKPSKGLGSLFRAGRGHAF
jgi:hypothetical protein